MVAKAATAATRARALLDAHVEFELARLTGKAQRATVAKLANDVLDALAGHQVADLVDRQALTAVVVEVIAAAPRSALVVGVVQLATDVAHEGPADPRPVSEFVDREQVEVLLDHLLALSPLYERALERLTDSPLVGTVAARFMGRIVGEVVATNQEIANKVPGLGSLVSLGTSAASRVKGAADKPFEALLGNSVGKGGSYAVRRLNRILIDTLRDPMTREAALQAWDLAAEEPMGGLGEHVTYDEAAGVVDAVHDLAAGLLTHGDAALLVEVVVDSFFDRFGGYTSTELLEQLDLSRADLVERFVHLAPGMLTQLHESGDLDRLVRSHLAPFYESKAARALL